MFTAPIPWHWQAEGKTCKGGPGISYTVNLYSVILPSACRRHYDKAIMFQGGDDFFHFFPSTDGSHVQMFILPVGGWAYVQFVRTSAASRMKFQIFPKLYKLQISIKCCVRRGMFMHPPVWLSVANILLTAKIKLLLSRLPKSGMDNGTNRLKDTLIEQHKLREPFLSAFFCSINHKTRRKNSHLYPLI